ncbi:unnamed protein product [Clonostachys byssicola]|uniref:Uncharacterized protein n=1 Tax=Clonostachys byssicola TaxID=160290 RepID=A0A9N9UM60_9HYPO|nr:unnamed protein product [Clonostachys byssicola]
MPATTSTYLVTGANRGIGRGFVEKLLLKPGTTVIAAVRDLSKAAASLDELPWGSGSRLIQVKIDSSIDGDAANAVSVLQEEHEITAVDIVIANAGISHSGAPVVENDPEAFRDHFNTNTIGPVTLLQAFLPLLKASETGQPLFLVISTFVGSIGGQESLANLPAVFSPYGASKAALNWIIRRLHYEEPWLTTWAAHPGVVLTDMGALFVSHVIDPATVGAVSVERSVSGILDQIAEATREEYGGKFKSYDGYTLQW